MVKPKQMTKQRKFAFDGYVAVHGKKNSGNRFYCIRTQ